MKLELKHLACYLPYGLKIRGKKHRDKYGEYPVYKLNGLSIQDNGIPQYEFVTDEDLFFAMVDDKHWKPILRPLSDLTKEIEIENKFIDVAKNLFPIDFGYGQIEGALCFLDYAKIFIQDNNRLNNCFPLLFWESLFKYHFDVFGLIEKNLAVDINTL